MLRIAIDCRMIGSGGIGSYISGMIPFLLERNECLLIGTHEQCMDFVRLENAEFCFCDVRPFSREEIFAFPRDVLEKIHKYDFFFTPYCNIPGGVKIPVFSTIHDVVFLDVPGLTGTFGRLARKFFYQRAIDKSAGIFTVSEFSKERIRANLRCEKPIGITYNAPPAYLFSEDETGGDAGDERGGHILFVGNIKAHKGLKVLLDAFLDAEKLGFGRRLVIAGNAENFRTGDRETARRIEEIARESPGKIEFTGRIPNGRLKSLYRSALALVQPSLYEGFGMPPLEAMSVGTRAVVSDIPVFREIYGGLPAVFFEAGNPASLCQRLLEIQEEADGTDWAAVREKILGRYSYRKSAETVTLAMEKFRESGGV